MSPPRRLMVLAAGMLLLLWFGLNYHRLSSDDDLILRLVLGSVLSLLIVARSKTRQVVANVIDGSCESRVEMDYQPADRAGGKPRDVLPVALALSGAVLMVLGIVFSVHQANWLGLLMMVYAVLRWALPVASRKDILKGIVLFYFVHPLPGQMFDPLQHAMQRLSVLGAEAVLHAVNVRVWADGMLLWTPGRSLGVPAACSGMSTAVTVLLLGLGTGLIFRLRWWENCGIAVLGLFQVLIMNIARVSFMVRAAPDRPDAWSATFLHDTSGLFLIAAIFLIQAEVSALRMWRVRKPRKRTHESDQRPADRRAALVGRVVAVTAAIVLVTGGLFLGARRMAPHHRAMMIFDVAGGLSEKDIATAERASRAAVALDPGNVDLMTQQVQILLLREKFAEALKGLAGIPSNELTVFHSVLESWGLMGIGRPDEAIAVLDSIPPDQQELPGVAITRAEFAATKDDVQNVTRNILLARQSGMTLSRIRALYPYLAARQQWKTIVDCQVDAPFNQSIHALIAAHAQMQEGELSLMARIVDDGVRRWPEESGFLEYLAVMAMMHPESRWEEMFAEGLKRGAGKLVADQLAGCMESAFAIHRPDLAWLACNRLAEIDPTHPGLYLIRARHADEWFVFRGQGVGFPSADTGDLIDLARFYARRRTWTPAPFIDEVRARDVSDTRKKHLSGAIDEFSRRERVGMLSPYMRVVWTRALDMDGRQSESERVKKTIPLKLPIRDAKLVQELESIRIAIMTRQLDAAAAMLERAESRWPLEAELTEWDAELADESGSSRLESRFESRLQAGLDGFGADHLLAYAIGGFKLGRPDLSWLALNRLSRIDTAHPGLKYAVAAFGKEWFVFKRASAGLSAVSAPEKTDITSLYLASLDWPEVPMADMMMSTNAGASRGEVVAQCLREIESRRSRGKATSQVDLMYPDALGLAGRYDDAHRELDSALVKYPGRRAQIAMKHAELYEETRQWDRVYESAREYISTARRPSLSVALMQMNALLRLRFAGYAMTMAQRASNTFPGSPRAQKAIGAICAAFGRTDEALYYLSRTPRWMEAEVAPELMWNSGRYREAMALAQVQGRPEAVPQVFSAKQSLLVPRAELALSMRLGPPRTDEELRKEAGQLRAKAVSDSEGSPFAKGLTGLLVRWRENAGSAELSDPPGWIAVGRDDTERAMALNELVGLLATQGRKAEARKAAELAIGMAPDSAMLWRAIIPLADGDPEVIQRARNACPLDPEVWLAWFVTGVSGTNSAPAWTDERIDTEVGIALASNLYPMVTVVRAGDYLRRSGHAIAASEIAQAAFKQNKEFLPVAVLAMRCAIQTGNSERALDAARAAIEISADPWPFIQVAAELETAMGRADVDTVRDIEMLRERFPGETRWSVKLCDVYYCRGEAEQALRVLENMVDRNPEQCGLRVMLMAAEAARLTGKLDRAMSVLEMMYRVHPNIRIVLNNLVYTFALDPGTLLQARPILPGLLEERDGAFAAYDTAATAYARSGDPERAAEFLTKVLASDTGIDTGIDTGWPGSSRTAADIELYIGSAEAAGSSRGAVHKAGYDELLPLARDLSTLLKKSASK